MKNMSMAISVLIFQGIRRKIVDELRESEHFAVMIDESTDITVDKHLSVCAMLKKEYQKQSSWLMSL